MAKYGHHVAYDFGQTVAGPANAWQLLVQFPFTELDPNSRDFVFMAWGVVGNVQLNGQTVGQVELELRRDLIAPVSPPVRIWGPYQNHLTPQDRGTSFLIVQRVSNLAPLTNPLSIYARYASPAPGQGNPTFRVDPISWLAFDLDTLGANKWAYKEYSGGPSGAPLAFLGAAPSLIDTVPLKWQSGSESWLCFMQTDMTPGYELLPYNTFLAHLPDGTWGSQTGHVGLAKHGTVSRGPIDVSGSTHRYHTGLFQKYVATSASDAIGFGGINLYNSGMSPWASKIWTGRLFAVNVDADVGFDEHVLGPGWAFYGETPTRDQQTLQLPQGARTLALARSVADVRNTEAKSFAGVVEQGGDRIGSRSPLNVLQVNTVDSMPEWISGEVLGRQGPNYLAWHGLRNPREPRGAPVPFWFTKEWYAITLSLRTSVDLGGYGQEQPGPVVVVRPHKEALGLGSLQALPFEPQDAAQVDAEEYSQGFKTASGHLVAWPLFTIGRNRWAMSWVLNRADRDTLVAFFAGLGDQAFKWTPPRGAEAAFVVVGDTISETAVSSGRAFEITAQVLGLVYIG